jgi:hypothetical protein
VGIGSDFNAASLVKQGAILPANPVWPDLSPVRITIPNLEHVLHINNPLFYMDKI